jgi:flagellin-like protein
VLKNRKGFKMDLVLKNMKKKGISPVIATVLLIAMVIVIGLIVFLFLRSMAQDAITKFGDENIELACDDVNFETSYSAGELYVANNGNTPIFGLKIKMVGDGSHTTKDIRDMSDTWPTYGLTQGGTFSYSVNTVSSTEIIVIPVLLGNSNSGQKTFVCDEERYGYEISI